MKQAGDATLRLLVDTNVWIDYFIDRSRSHAAAVSLVSEAQAADVDLFSSIETTKDVFYMLSCEFKRMQREATGEVSEQFAHAANEAAWSCLASLRRRSIVVGADSSDMVEAMARRANHADYEDNLQIAAALRARATHIVSSDKRFQAHSPIPCVSIEEARRLMT